MVRLKLTCSQQSGGEATLWPVSIQQHSRNQSHYGHGVKHSCYYVLRFTDN